MSTPFHMDEYYLSMSPGIIATAVRLLPLVDQNDVVGIVTSVDSRIQWKRVTS